MISYRRKHDFAVHSPLPLLIMDVTKFAFEFDDVLPLNVFRRFEICGIFLDPVIEFESLVFTFGATCMHPSAILL